MRNLPFLLLVSIAASGCGIFGPSAPPTVQVDAVQSHTNQSTIAITGSTGADGGDATIEIIGGQAIVTGNASGEGKFSVSVRLRTNQPNNLSVVGFHDPGSRSNASNVNIIHDNIAPGPLGLNLPRYTNQNPFLLTGISEAGASISAATATATNQATAAATGAFSVSIPLTPNISNEITLGTTDLAQNSGSPTVVNVIHDGVAPTLTTSQPADSLFDTDGDSRVNIAFSFDDDSGAVDPATISVTNDRPIGGGAALGGYDAGTNILQAFNGDLIMIDGESATYNASLDHEFPVGTNTLTVSVADSAGNIKANTVQFDVHGTEPSFTITSLGNGDAPPLDSLVVASEFSDVAGRIDENSLVFQANQKLIGLLTQEGTKEDDIAAGENFAHLFSVDSTAASFRPRLSNGLTTRAFPAGELTISGSMADRAGNISTPDTVTFTYPTYPHTLLVLNSTAAPAAVEHVVPIGLTNFTSFRGVQFTVGFPASVMTVDSVTSAGRVSFSPFYERSVSGDEGRVEIVLVDLAGNPIPDGSAVVIHIYTSVSSSAQTATDAVLVISDVEGSDEVGNPVSIAVLNGILRIR